MLSESGVIIEVPVIHTYSTKFENKFSNVGELLPASAEIGTIPVVLQANQGGCFLDHLDRRNHILPRLMVDINTWSWQLMLRRTMILLVKV